MSSPDIVRYQNLSSEVCPFLPMVRVGQTLYTSALFSFCTSNPPSKHKLSTQIDKILTSTDDALTAVHQQLQPDHIQEFTVIYGPGIKEKSIKSLIKKEVPTNEYKITFLKTTSFPYPIGVQIAMKVKAPYFDPLPSEFTIETKKGLSSSTLGQLDKQIHDIFVEKIGKDSLPNMLRLHLTISTQFSLERINDVMEEVFSRVQFSQEDRNFTFTFAFQKQVPALIVDADVLIRSPS